MQCYSVVVVEVPLAVAQQQLQQHQQQQNAPQHQQQQNAPQQQQFFVIAPTPIVAEMLPLVIKICKARLLLLDRQQQNSPHQGSSHTPSARTAAQERPQVDASELLDILHNYANVVAELVSASIISLDHSFIHVTPVAEAQNEHRQPIPNAADHSAEERIGSTSAASTPDAAAAVAASLAASSGAVSACGTPAAPHSFLHSRDVFAAHAVDTMATLEGVVCTMNRDLSGWAGDKVVVIAVVMQQLAAAAVLLARQAGLGSAELQHCYSFLASLLKLGAGTALHSNLSKAGVVCHAAAQGAVALLETPALHGGTDQQPQLSSQVLMDSSATSLLPSFIILGRFLLHLVQQLQTVAGPDQELPQGDTQPQLPAAVLLNCRRVAGMVGAAEQWLQAHSTELAAAGYSPIPLLQHLQCELPTSSDAVPGVAHTTPAPSGDASEQPPKNSSSSSSSSSTSIDNISDEDVQAVAAQELRLTALALCNMAVPCLCNNPGCSNTSGPTELSLVSGPSCVCGGCRVAHYCSRACQSQHWKQHKPVCRALAAAGVAAGSAVTPNSVLPC